MPIPHRSCILSKKILMQENCDSLKYLKEILQNPERSLLEARKSWHPPRHEAKQP